MILARLKEYFRPMLDGSETMALDGKGNQYKIVGVRQVQVYRDGPPTIIFDIVEKR